MAKTGDGVIPYFGDKDNHVQMK